jgi:hypothetical protein
MDLQDILKQFKRIEPDPTYTDYSRRAILASSQIEKLTVKNVLMHIFETAGSVALVGVLIFAITGGFSGSKYLAPVQFSGIDPAALHAEAQAIDMQINLANLTYTEAAHIAESTPLTVNSAAPTPTPLGAAAPAFSTSTGATAIAPETTPSSSISINEALQKLTE